jgi:hypothetical protein
MASNSGFFKGEQKKKKKDQKQKPISIAPVFTPPKIIGKGKRWDE